MNKEIKLGDKVRDKITGFIGIAVARTKFLNGCIQYNVIPKCVTKDKLPEEMGIDIDNLEVITKKKKPTKKKSTGGANRIGFKQRGF